MTEEELRASDPFVVWERWLEWLYSYEGWQHRLRSGGDGTDYDLLTTVPNPPGRAIFTVGDLKALVQAGRQWRTRGRL